MPPSLSSDPKAFTVRHQHRAVLIYEILSYEIDGNYMVFTVISVVFRALCSCSNQQFYSSGRATQQEQRAADQPAEARPCA